MTIFLVRTLAIIIAVDYMNVNNFLFVCLFVCLQIKPEMLDTLYKYAKFQYECGNYSGAAEYLYFYRVLVSSVL